MTPDDDQRALQLQALEERLSFQQRMLEELNEVVLRQERRLEQLSRDLARCVGAVDRLAASAGDDLPHEKPPHY